MDSGGTRLGKIADWITIITAPLTVITTFAAWFGKLDDIPVSGRKATTVYAVLILLITIVWAALFFIQLRVLIALARKLPDIVVLFVAILVSILALAVFISVELLILDAFIPNYTVQSGLVMWVAVPVGLWVCFAFVAIMMIVSGDWTREANQS